MGLQVLGGVLSGFTVLFMVWIHSKILVKQRRKAEIGHLRGELHTLDKKFNELSDFDSPQKNPEMDGLFETYMQSLNDFTIIKCKNLSAHEQFQVVAITNQWLMSLKDPYYFRLATRGHHHPKSYYDKWLDIFTSLEWLEFDRIERSVDDTRVQE